MNGLEIARGDELTYSVIIEDEYYRIRHHKKNDIKSGINYVERYYLNCRKEWKYTTWKRSIDDNLVKAHPYLEKWLPLLNSFIRKQKLAKLLS